MYVNTKSENYLTFAANERFAWLCGNMFPMPNGEGDIANVCIHTFYSLSQKLKRNYCCLLPLFDGLLRCFAMMWLFADISEMP